MMKICIFGSETKDTPKEFTDAGYELGLKIAENGHSLVFGGGNEGMMGAVAAGVYANGGHITSIMPHWMVEHCVEFENCDEYIRTDTMNERKELFLEKADVFITCPGGLGTLEEFFDMVSLKYLDRHSKPIILFNINHIYDKLIDYILEIYDDGFVHDEALDIGVMATSVEEVFKYIDEE